MVSSARLGMDVRLERRRGTESDCGWFGEEMLSGRILSSIDARGGVGAMNGVHGTSADVCSWTIGQVGYAGQAKG